MDYDHLLKETTLYLQEYIRIETVNPPGHEIAGAKFFKKIFDEASIPCEIFEPAAGRGSLLATLKGSGEKRPLLLLSHIDVVPAEKEKWEVDPFSGVVKEGYLYGRGALDNKSMGVVEMMALLILKREGIPLKRDLLFFASADEETGGKWGVQWAMDHVPSLKESEYALNEGGYITLNEDQRADRYDLSNGQKVLYQLRLKARGTSGHASMPHRDNPNVKLVQALGKLAKWKTPYHILPMVKDYFMKIAPKQPAEDRPFYEDIKQGLRDPSFSSRFTANPIHNAMVRNTVSPTVLQAGSKVNVIPSESTATLDCRLIPGSSKKTFLNRLKRKLGDEIEVEVIAESQSHRPSPVDTDLFRAIQGYAARNDPGCPVVSTLLPGATDSRFLREKGIIAYDFCPFRLTEKELMRVHGHNERVSLENLKFGMKMLVELIQEV